MRLVWVQTRSCTEMQIAGYDNAILRPNCEVTEVVFNRCWNKPAKINLVL